MFKLFTKKEIVPEVLLTHRWRFPDKLEVAIKKSSDGGYVAFVKNLEGCMSQAETGEELFEMVNDAVYTYLKVPEEYKAYMPSFFPPEEARKQLGITIPAKFLGKELILERT